MLLIKEKFIQFILDGKFNGNQNQCAQALRMNPPQLNKFLNNKSTKAGAKFLGAVYAYCEKEKIEFRDLIILPKL
ncbi:MAG: family transcriptional regulator [Firmicutes bacterium]|nr:family transcriptional regulator [Bacillota bacterium]